MAYVDAIYDRESDTVRVVERVDGERVYTDRKAEHVFYHASPTGQHRSIFGDSLTRFATSDSRRFRAELGRMKRAGTAIFESDVSPVVRSLASHYTGAETPALHLGFFDIEADWDPQRGWAPCDDPFNAVTAITLYLSATQVLHTVALCPPTMTLEEAQAATANFPDTTVYDDECDMLEHFLVLIEDVDVLSGWNSEGYDIPYLVNRVGRKLGSRHKRRFCLWDQEPREREYVKFGRSFSTFETVGRVHLDYLLLYQKHNTQQQQSYKLASIGEAEVGETKTQYEGNLDDLYKKDFTRFVEYNRQDVHLLVLIDKKRKFIELANQIAHANTVLLKTTMGSVALVETAIINSMHAMGFIVPDRRPREDKPEPIAAGDDDDEEEAAEDGRTPVAGAYVAKPRVGLQREVGCTDLNSLYPSAIRALNMSPETIYAQVRLDRTMELVNGRIASGTPRAEAWEGLFSTIEVADMQARNDQPVFIDFIDRRASREMTAGELYDWVFDPQNHLCITANGTIFRTDKDGIIPRLLGEWYAHRKSQQASMKEWQRKLREANSDEQKKHASDLVTFYDQRQLATKILLNSLYGALLNEALRFYDERLGQSVTLTGRSIVRHSGAKINEIITGVYDHAGEAIVYGDTDSVYFSAYQVLKDKPEYEGFDWSRENIIEFYDGISDAANASFPEFMARAFNVAPERGAIIAAGRELVASTSLFIKKKKYACLMYDKEGERLDVGGKPGKLKAMGLDLKRADTPKFMQKFLADLLMNLLTGKPKAAIFDDIRAFRIAFKSRPAWEKGSPKKVSNMTGFADQVAAAGKAGLTGRVKSGQKLKVVMPGHVRASLHWNTLCDMHADRFATRITDGNRIVVCKLRPNAMAMDSVAYPVDEPHLPSWFKALPFDHEAMETVIVDQKLLNLVGVLGWDLGETQDRAGDEFFTFG